MIAPNYARKTTEQDVPDEQNAVTRQVEHGRAYAARKGWTVREEAIFVDDGVSGTEFKKRPGLIRLLSTLKPSPSFQVLTMPQASRLGRENIESEWPIIKVSSISGLVEYHRAQHRPQLANTA